MNGPQAALRCPTCATPLAELERTTECAGCGREIVVAEGIPLLIEDLEAIEGAIEEARGDARAGWYSDPQAIQLSGPYRHHVAKRRAYLDDLLRRRLDGDARMGTALDLGCGDGNHLGWLGEHATRVFGSDYNLLRLVRAAQGNPDATVFLADATNYPAADESFDLIFMNHVLEHIPDAATALAEVRRVLKPGGHAIIGVPNEGAGWWRLAYRLEPEVRASTDHVHFFTADALSRASSDAGLEVLEVEALGWGLPHFSLDARVRGHKWVDDLFERVGRRIIPRQASSLYLTATR